MHLEASTSQGNESVSGSFYGASGATQRGLLTWWYGLAAPEEPPNSTSRDRERVRAGRLSSIILLIVFGFGISLLPNALTSTSHTFLFTVLAAMALNLVALLFNRQGRVALVGVGMVIVVEAAFVIVDVTLPTGLTTTSLKIFYLAVLTELIAVSLLPPKSVFLVMLVNNVFTWAAITLQPRASDLQIPTATAYYNTLATPLVLQIIVAIVTYLWVQGATQAIERAEQVAALERALAEQDRAVAEQKQQLEHGIHQILQTHIQVANGNFEARAPLARENVLWQVAYSLNNLLTRLQRAIQSESELQRTQVEARHLLDAVRQAKMGRRPIFAQRSSTVLDPLAQELAGNVIEQQ